MLINMFKIRPLSPGLQKIAAKIPLITLIYAFIFITLPNRVQAQNVSMTTTNWAPFYAESLDQGGFVTAIVDASFKAAGYDTAIKFTSWTDALEQVKEGKKDVVVGAYFSEDRAQHYHYSLPIYSVLTGVFKKAGHELDFYTSLDTLDQYKLGKLDGTVVAKSFDAYPFKHLKGYEQVSLGLKALDQGEIDLYVESYAVAKQVAADMGMQADKIEMIQPPLEDNDLHIMISKNIPNAIEIRDAFNKGFVQIQTNGTYETILKEFNQM
ncbi:transporter substrate-binding domain-containing protein [Marinomonas sp. MED121]|uniref:substrate-binding periplasmic protein n=1 Tax=Marinomonas sp. MED121 TaxID=314277 RepID=UPI0002F83729|nr:transporter substrate-binding domain-containing protein [Marinomonas sp. MED121]